MSLKRSMLYNVASQGGVLVFGTINAILSAQVLGPEGKGQFAIYMLSIEIGVVLMLLGMNQAIQYFAARDEFNKPKTFNTSVVFALVCAAFFGLIIQSFFWAGQGERVLAEPFNSPLFRAIITVHFLNQFFGYLIISLLNSHKLFVQTSGIQIFSVSINLMMYAALFIAHFYMGQTVLVNYFYYALLITAVLRIAIAVYVYFKHVKHPIGGRTALFSGKEMRTFFAFGVFPWLSLFMLRAVLKLDFWFVEYFHGLDTLGLYSQASNVGEMLYLVPNTLGLVVLSYIADPETRSHSTDRTAMLSRIFFSVMIVGSLGFALFSTNIFAFAFGEEFRESGAIFNLLLLGIVPFSLANILIGFLTGANQLKHILVSTSAGFLLTIVLDMWLVPTRGAYGAAIATVVAYNAITWYLVFRFKATTGIGYRQFLLPTGEDLARIKLAITRK